MWNKLPTSYWPLMIILVYGTIVIASGKETDISINDSIFASKQFVYNSLDFG